MTTRDESTTSASTEHDVDPPKRVGGAAGVSEYEWPPRYSLGQRIISWTVAGAFGAGVVTVHLPAIPKNEDVVTDNRAIQYALLVGDMPHIERTTATSSSTAAPLHA